MNNARNVVANNNNNISNGGGTVDGDDCHHHYGGSGSRSRSGSFDSESDGTTTDMNWMDVGTEIGMKLLYFHTTVFCIVLYCIVLYLCSSS
jgi:hypothetical protein